MTGRKWFFWIMKHLWNRLKIQLEISAPSTLWPVWRFSVTFLDFLANINFSSFHRGACLVYCCVAGGPPHILIVVITHHSWHSISKKPKHKKNYTNIHRQCITQPGKSILNLSLKKRWKTRMECMIFWQATIYAEPLRSRSVAF